MPGHFIARNLRDFLARRSRHRFDFYLARIREHGHDSGVMRGVRKDGSERLADAFNNLLTVISSPLRCSSRITVLDAPTGAEAIRVLMPGMTGRELYEPRPSTSRPDGLVCFRLCRRGAKNRLGRACCPVLRTPSSLMLGLLTKPRRRNSARL